MHEIQYEGFRSRLRRRRSADEQPRKPQARVAEYVVNRGRPEGINFIFLFVCCALLLGFLVQLVICYTYYRCPNKWLRSL